MYEESVGVPMLTAGPGIVSGHRVKTPVSHVDFFPSILQAVGAQALTPNDLPGKSFFDLAHSPFDPSRAVFSEYHAAGSVSASYMLRRGPYKYIHYTGFEPELFDLERDPEEVHDLAGDPSMAEVLARFGASLNQICDPLEMDRQAKADQQALIKAHGGEAKILARGGSSYTPIPGEEVKLMGHHP
jgi:choline-sulfatase